MANVVEATPVVLDGPGFRPRIGRKYGPGEFRQLKNCEVYEGSIRTRKSIHAASDSDTPFTNPSNILGYVDKFAFITTFAGTGDKLFYIDQDVGYVESWNPALLPQDTFDLESWHRVVGVYLYNNKYHFLTYEYNNPLGTYRFHLYTLDYNYGNPPSPVFSDYTHTLLLVITPGTNEVIDFNNFFVQGERLWICTNHRVYFSAATDHTNFAVPSGGFFDFQGELFTHAYFNRDTIYILSDDSVFGVTYNTDPNVDSVAVQVSTALGGQWGCVHGGSYYFINDLGIYSIVNNVAQKVMDTNFDEGYTYLYRYKLVSYQQYLVALRYENEQYESYSYGQPEYGYKIGPSFTPGQYGNELGVNCLFINTDNGSVHELDFKDQVVTVPDCGYVSDILFGCRNRHGDSSLLLLTNRSMAGTSWRGHLYFMMPSQEVAAYDVIYDTVGNTDQYKIQTVVEIDSWAPDGTEFFMKKFRSIMLMASPPGIEFQISFAFDDGPYGAPIPFTYGTNDNYDISTRPPYPFRFPLNQKAKCLSIKLECNNVNSPLINLEYNDMVFDLNDIVVNWTPTNRGLSTRTP